MRARPWRLVVFLVPFALSIAPLVAQEAPPLPEDLSALAWREIGPYRGGRVAAVCGIPGDRDTYYMGSCGGGVWKTTDGGRTWKNVSDGYFGGSIGAVAVSEWDPNVVYVGGGEKTVRGNVSHGDGMWKSEDAGKTWRHVGLSDSRHICRIRIHPKNSDIAYAAVLGHLFGPNKERGIYRTLDGGKTWKRILFESEDAGAVDLVMDPTNPRILYSGFWRVLRTPWSLESGGEGSGLFKSTDGGDSWDSLMSNEGLPEGPIGICGITVSPSQPENLYAIIEAEKGGVFRSRDGGATWSRTNDDRDLRQRAWYYSRIYADPIDQDVVYVLNVSFHRSKDGGKSFSRVSTPHGDNHDLWIDPADPKRMIESNDGGANVSTDGGRSWSSQDNQPTAQMYRVSVDNAYPYRLLGGQQDNSALRIRSRSLTSSGIGERDWDPTAGGESGHVVAHPEDPDLVFGGSYGGYLSMVHHGTGQRRSVDVWPDNPMGSGAAGLRYRFQWNFPLFFSPHDPDQLYAAANVLFRSDDNGASWRPLSPDLTRDDKEKMGPSGGPITKDNTSVEYYGTIFAACESPRRKGLLWTGSDDGRIHLSRDDGTTWEDVTPEDMPEWMMINSVEPHPTVDGGLYVAGTRYKLDDLKPYLYKTLDYGKTWEEIVDGIEDDHFTRVIRADPLRAGLLFAGTERGVYYSTDDGASWSPLKQNLPIVPITDLAVHRGDLIAATQGRGYWILDDLTPLTQWTAAIAEKDAWLFKPRPTDRVPLRRRANPSGMGTNPLPGVVLSYSVRQGIDADEPFTLTIKDADNRTLATFEPIPSGEKASGKKRLSREAGIHRLNWDLELEGPKGVSGMILWNGLPNPTAPPGTYTAVLAFGKQEQIVEIVVRPDPRSETSVEDLLAQHAFITDGCDKLSEINESIEELRRIRDGVRALDQRLEKIADAADARALAKTLIDGMTEVEEALYQTKNKSNQDPLNFPIRLNDKLAGVVNVAATGDFAPTRQAFEVKQELTEAIDAQLARLRALWSDELPQFNGKVAGLALPAVPAPKSKRTIE